MKVGFFGLPLAALLLDRDGHDVVWAGVCRRGAVGSRRLLARIGRSRVHVEPEVADDAIVASLRQSRPDLLVSWFWTKKLPPRVLALAPAFGVHPSLLPRHRGADPYFWTIDCGDNATGVTAHALAAEYDTGPILAQRSLALDPSWDAWRLARALDRPSLALLREVAAAFARGRAPAAQPQDEAAATMAPEPTDSDLALRWSWSAARIERRVRAAGPWPGAWTEIEGRIVTVLRVGVTSDFPPVLAPGEAAVRGDGVAVVRAGEGAVELLAGRDEDDTPLVASDFARLVLMREGGRSSLRRGS